MDYNEISKILEELTGRNKLIDKSAISLVGKLCKRIECLQEINSLSPTQLKEIFKSLSKELTYENSRELKRQIKYIFLPSVRFISKSKEE